ncbi:pentatricopeptide repeat-containing protein At2g01510, mitochondrial [Amborella trichopoda]|uniref:pentatricopeptide repeat-containing protein At2g01510, mitochondrial n=1 Tax=Amborella trichopoda TaxID=13333 RepID=UPI0009BF05F5|nr:pentatricopeptide repeat-containing protein At2g01510, mitochondrial [Amborella trichopoda]|eukprot:XP_011620749.2 pentatricopeptide repeat-containing protein At2g01510, mitochondrial [Amborella trichopoda]
MLQLPMEALLPNPLHPTKTLTLSPNPLHSCKTLDHLRQAHAQLLKSPSLSFNLNLATKLISSYTALGDPPSALQASLHHPKTLEKDAFYYNALIQAHLSLGQFAEALAAFSLMLSDSHLPNPFSLPPLLKACSSSPKFLPFGPPLHALYFKCGIHPNSFVCVAIIDLYAKHGLVREAQKAFDAAPKCDHVVWNAMLSGLTQTGRPLEALSLFCRMIADGVRVDSVAVACTIAACAQLCNGSAGAQTHARALRSGCLSPAALTSLIELYAACSDPHSARHAFDEIEVKDHAAFNSVVSCYAQNGLSLEALRLFQEIRSPNKLSLVAVLPAIARVGLRLLVKSAHAYIVRRGFELDEYVITALMDTYVKCGELETSRHLFDVMPQRSVVAWSSIIAGYGAHGLGEEALELFSEMQAHGVNPNYVTFIGVLSACSHARLVNEGRRLFESMGPDYGVAPRAQHYACLVDLLGRAGLLSEALHVVQEMPIEPSHGVWGALLGACRIHKDVELAQFVTKRLFDAGCDDPGFYVLLSNIYASVGLWGEVEKVRELMRARGLRKPPGWSSIELDDKVHIFLSGDVTHLESDEIYKKLEQLFDQLRKLGYVPDVNAVLQDIDDDEKERVLRAHSEKLAIAYGLIRTKPGTPIRIMKNLRTCEDCHVAAKLVSKLTERAIVLRDAVRFHHMRDGVCSCGDYW